MSESNPIIRALKFARATVDEKREALSQLIRDPDVIDDSVEIDFRRVEKGPPAEIEHIGDSVDAAVKRMQHGDQLVGVSSGYPSIDKLTKGFAPGELIIVMGHTSHGKSQLIQNISDKVANRGEAVLIISLEMTKAENTGRLIKLAGGGETAVSHVMKLPIIYPKSNEVKASDIDRLVQTAVSENVKLVVIDHLHYFSRSIEHSTAEIGRLVNSFKQVAVKHDVPIILVSHIVKLPQKTAPGIEHLRDSSFIGQDADIILSVWRNENEPQQMLVKILKNRNRGFDPARATTNLYIQDGIRLLERIV